MAYRQPDDESRRRGEAELLRHDELAMLAVDGQARRAGLPTRALAPVAPALPPLDAREVGAALRELPASTREALQVAFTPPWLRPVSVSGALFGAVAGVGLGLAILSMYAAVVYALTGVVLALAFTVPGPLESNPRLASELAWLRALPFPLDGYLELLALRCAVPFELLARVELPIEEVSLVTDLVDRARGDAALATERTASALRIRAPWPTPPELVRVLCDEVLVRLHALYPIERAAVKPGV